MVRLRLAHLFIYPYLLGFIATLPLAGCEQAQELTEITNVTGNESSTVSGSRLGDVIDNSNSAPNLDSITAQSIDENTALSQVDPGVLGVDIDADGQNLTYSCNYEVSINSTKDSFVGTCLNLPGTASFNETTGVFDWTPDYSAAGNYEIWFTASDGSLSGDALLSVTVANVDAPPLLQSITDVSASEGSTLSPAINASDESGGDVDQDGDTITYTCYYDTSVDDSVADSSSCAGLTGASFNSSTGVFNWTPDQQAYSNGDSSGRYEFKISGSSSGGNDSEIFIVTVLQVNSSPSLSEKLDKRVEVSSAMSSIDVGDSGDDSDADGDTITYTCSYDSVSNDSEDATNSCSGLGFSFDTSTGVLSGTPTTAGTYEFQVTGSDGSLSDNIFFTITVANPPDGVFVQIGSSFYGSNCAVTGTGAPYCWGYDDYSNLGNGATTGDQATPDSVTTTNLSTGTTFVKMQPGGAYHNCGLASDGLIYCWGSSGTGRLGNNSTSGSQFNIPVQAHMNNVTSGETFVDLAANTHATCGLTNSGTMYCTGSQSGGKLATGASSGNIARLTVADSSNLATGEVFKKIDVSSNHGCGVTSFGNVFCWGEENNGKVGNNSTSGDELIPVAVVTTNLSSGEAFVDVATGGNTSCGLTNLGKVFCWGDDAGGNLGTGSIAGDLSIPTQVDTTNVATGVVFTGLDLGDGHSCASTSDGNLFCWGYDSWSGLGDGGTDTNMDEPVQVDQTNLTSGNSFVSFSTGQYGSCSINNLGAPFCWGSDTSAQLGNGAVETTAKDIPVAVDMSGVDNTVAFKKLFAGSNHSCGITSTGTAFCWGQDDDGELGVGAAVSDDQSEPTAVDISNLTSGESFVTLALGGNHTCGITNTGNSFCFGDDTYGQLGNGATSDDQAVPVSIDTSSFATGETLVKIYAGLNHSCGLTGAGKAYCWGDSSSGQLGNGSTTGTQIVPVAVDISNITSGESFLSLSLGNRHSCGVTSVGEVFCWGDDSSGQIGNGATTGTQSIPVQVDESNLSTGEKFSAIALGTSHSCALTYNGKTYCWGSDESGQVGNGATTGDQASPVAVDLSALTSGESFIEISSGSNHVCAFSNTREMFCWGSDSVGQVGNAATSGNQTSPVTVDTSNLATGEGYIALAAGGDHVCATNNSGDTLCWGSDSYGQLGNGSPLSDQNLPVEINSYLY